MGEARLVQNKQSRAHRGRRIARTGAPCWSDTSVGSRARTAAAVLLLRAARRRRSAAPPCRAAAAPLSLISRVPLLRLLLLPTNAARLHCAISTPRFLSTMLPLSKLERTGQKKEAADCCCCCCCRCTARAPVVALDHLPQQLRADVGHCSCFYALDLRVLFAESGSSVSWCSCAAVLPLLLRRVCAASAECLQDACAASSLTRRGEQQKFQEGEELSEATRYEPAKQVMAAAAGSQQAGLGRLDEEKSTQQPVDRRTTSNGTLEGLIETQCASLGARKDRYREAVL